MAEKRVQRRLAAILTRRSGRLAIAAMALAVLVGCSSPTTIEGSYWKWPHVGSNAVAITEVRGAYSRLHNSTTLPKA